MKISSTESCIKIQPFSFNGLNLDPLYLNIDFAKAQLKPTNRKLVINLSLVKSLFLLNSFLNVTLVRDVVKISIVGEINGLVCIVYS